MDKETAKAYKERLEDELEDNELFEIYYKVESFRLPEHLWRWQVVMEYKGILIFRLQLSQIMDIIGNHAFSINLETKEIIIW